MTWEYLSFIDIHESTVVLTRSPTLLLPSLRVLKVGKYPSPRVLEVRGERISRWPFRKLRW